MEHYDADNGRLDWLDLGPEPESDQETGASRRWHWWYGLVAAMVVAALLLTRAQHGTNRAATTPATASRTGPSTKPPTPTPQAPRTAVPSQDSLSSDGPSDGLSDSALPQPVTVTKAGHRLLDVPADWELFGQGQGSVVRIELASGRVTRTALPALSSTGPVYFLVGPDSAIVRPMDSVPSYVVHDGKPATELPAAFQQSGAIVPGPAPHQVWVQTDTGTASALTLMTLDGRPAGVQIAIPKAAGIGGSDEAGYTLMFGIGGVYDARQDGLHRVTGGALLAFGPTRWLTLECDERYDCVNVVTDRVSGARHTVSAPLYSYGQTQGSISPDGGTAALLQFDGTGAAGVHLVDLATGADRVSEARTSMDQGLGGRTVVWSPDSRWLFVTDGAGQLSALNRATMRVVHLDVHVGNIGQLAFRSAGH